MKNLYLIFALIFLGLTSCSTNDNDANDAEGVFLPLTANSAWVYDVNIDSQTFGRDSLFVDGEQIIDGKTYQKLSTKELSTGFYTSTLSGNNIRKDSDKLRLTGSTGLGISEFLPINIALSDFVIFKENASNNTELDAITGTIEQDLQSLPLKIEYSLKTFFKESLSTFSVPGKQTYNNVKVMKVVANIKVTTRYLIPVINTPITISIINPQDVVVSTQYYAEGIGMIYAKSEVNLVIEDFSNFGIELPIPQESTSTIEEFLN